MNEQLAKHINPSRGQYHENAVAMTLLSSGAIVAASLALAVWSAKNTATIDNAGNN